MSPQQFEHDGFNSPNEVEFAWKLAAERAPMTRSRHPDVDMHLPAGKTCADCRHFPRCSKIYGHISADEVCDWAPSSFQQRVVIIAQAPGWTAEEEEQFRALERVQASGEAPC